MNNPGSEQPRAPSLHSEASAACELAFDLLSVEGPDSRKFLQGQLTCNLEHLSATRSLRGAYCNLKGRVICDFRLFLRDETLYLQTQAGMGERLKQTLDKYIVFSRARTALCHDVRRFGLSAQSAARIQQAFPGTVLQEDACRSNPAMTVVRAEGSPERFELFQFAGSPFVDQLLRDARGISARDWQRADIEAGVVHITPALQELHTPQVLNYDQMGLIDFRKGCYTGQEIIARMHYRGKAKRRLYRVHADRNVIPHAVSITHDDSSSEGEILSCIREQESTQLLAILPCEAVEMAGVITLQAPDGTVPAQVLPFNRQETVAAAR